MNTTIDEKFFEKWKDKDVAMHCKTSEEAKEFCRLMHENGLEWGSGDSYLYKILWNTFDKNTCYVFNKGIYGDYEELMDDDRYTILEFEDYIVKEEPLQEIVPQNVIYHEVICTMLNKMYQEKNSDYGNNFAKVRAEFPNSILIRLSDKLERLKTLYKQDAKVKDETIEDTLMDLANYAIMELVERRMENDC